MKELSVRADRDQLGTVIDFINETIEEAGGSMKAVMQVELAVEEIFINIASYAYGTDGGDATIRVDMTDNGKVLVIEFIDSGMPFDPLAKDDPDVMLPAEQRGIGGLGIFLVKKNMDSVEYRYEDRCNILTIRKTIK